MSDTHDSTAAVPRPADPTGRSHAGPGSRRRTPAPRARDVAVRQQIERLRTWQRLLDEAFRVPGTRLRFGWDPIIGLIPWAGDVIAACMGIVLLYHGFRMRLPAVVQARMVLNVAIDLALGAVPVVGDIADLFWKSSTKNLALVERHAEPEQPATWHDWAFVIGVGAIVIVIASLPFVALIWMLSSLGRQT